MFGATSFFHCFGMSAFGAFLLSVNPWLTFIVCVVPRVLCGWLTGPVCKGLQRLLKENPISYYVTSLAAALLNTILFMGAVFICFWRNDYFLSQMSAWQIPTNSILAFLIAFVGVNGVVEAVVNTIAAGTVAKVRAKVNKR